MSAQATQKTKADKFPLVFKNGSSAVKVYRDRKPSGDYFRVVYYLGGKRERLNFASLDEARKEAMAKAAQLARGDIDAVQLTGKDRLTYGRALDAVKAFDIPLDAAAMEYAEARKTLSGNSLVEAARFYMRHHGKGIMGKLVSEAVTEFHLAKADAGRSALYLKDITYRLRAFAEAFSCEVRHIAPQDVADFMNDLKLAPRSFNNHVLMLKTFFKFCQSRSYLSTEVNLLVRVERRKQAVTDIEVFTPKELRNLLAEAPARVATCIAIQAFAGVRTAELLRLTWHDIERRKGHIEISAGKAKTASRRLIPITENLLSWLHTATKQKDRIWPVAESEYYEQLAKVAENAKVPWKKNALRHSFITYRVAQTKDVAATALEAGNSPKMIFAHYRELATATEAKEWFGIVPAKGAVKNIVRMAS